MTRRLTTALTVALSLGGALSTFPALAQSCGDDLQKLAQKRDAALQVINGLVKAAKAKGAQLDAALFCAKSAGLNAAENVMIAYMEKNKDWCQIPDEVVGQLKENHVKSAAFSAKACKVAADMKKREQEGAAAQAQALPTGPL